MMNDQYTISKSRRNFLKGTGAVLFFASIPFTLPLIGSKSPEEGGQEQFSEGEGINVWIKLMENGKVQIMNPASEMGQGSMTALAVIIAEELDVDWADVEIINSPADPELYGAGWGGRGSKSMITVGSRTVMSYYNMLRQVGGQARYVLLKSVADHWKTTVSELTTTPGIVLHKASGKNIKYGEILPFINTNVEVPELTESQLKKPEDFRLIGKYIERFDIPEKVDGSAIYAIDVRLPNMVYGVISRSPVNGASPTLMNEASIKSMKGVEQIVVLDHGIGVVATSLQHALDAKQALEIQWSKGATAESHNSETIFSEYEMLASKEDLQKEMIYETGNVKDVFKNAVKTYVSDYKNDYVYHGQMEPLNAVVKFADDLNSVEIWLGTQAPGNTRRAVANYLKMDYENVTIHRTYLGGGFGRRSTTDYVMEALDLAKAAGRPVKLLWTRQDDLQYGMFRPICMQRMEAAVGADGSILGWKHLILGTGGGLLGSGARPEYYGFPNQEISVHNIDHGIRTKHWRAVGHGPNKYAIESFMDEIAMEQNMDPLAFRLKAMADYPRAQKVLTTVAEMANWGEEIPEGRARGLAFAERSSSLAACICEISYDEETGIRVHKVWSSLDAGVVVQPDNAIAQMEGAIIMGIGSVLKEKISITNGAVDQSNYHDYEILGIEECPEFVKVAIIPSTERPTGIGESGIPVIGPAIANAFFALSGVMLKHMPFTPERIKEAIEG